MKKDIVNLLCCPVCKGELDLEVKEEENDEVTQGFFTCSKCNVKYPIDNAIPNLLPKKD